MKEKEKGKKKIDREKEDLGKEAALGLVSVGFWGACWAH